MEAKLCYFFLISNVCCLYSCCLVNFLTKQLPLFCLTVWYNDFSFLVYLFIRTKEKNSRQWNNKQQSVYTVYLAFDTFSLSCLFVSCLSQDQEITNVGSIGLVALFLWRMVKVWHYGSCQGQHNLGNYASPMAKKKNYTRWAIK